jgi:hypothetical protein
VGGGEAIWLLPVGQNSTVDGSKPLLSLDYSGSFSMRTNERDEFVQKKWGSCKKVLHKLISLKVVNFKKNETNGHKKAGKRKLLQDEISAKVGRRI